MRTANLTFAARSDGALIVHADWHESEEDKGALRFEVAARDVEKVERECRAARLMGLRHAY